MKIVRVLLYIPACIVFIMAAGAYLGYIYQAGFPDGFMSEKEHAEKILFTFFFWVSVFFGFYFLRLAWVLSQKEDTKKIFFWCAVYIGIILVTYFIDVYLFADLMDSSGG